MSVFWTLGAWIVYASGQFDRAFRLFDRARARLILAVANPRLLDAYNDLTFGRSRPYHAGDEQFRHELFHWEEDVIASAFPPAPARVLVGGAGGGREAFALSRLGYQVVAFEPSPALLVTMTEHDPDRTIRAYRARYEELPRLQPARVGEASASLNDLGPFDVAVLGWGSYSHLCTPERRVAAVRAMASACRGPVIVSFFGAPAGKARDAFSVPIGFYHYSDEDEIRRVAAAAGLDVQQISMDDRDGRWPFAILRRRTDPAAGS